MSRTSFGLVVSLSLVLASCGGIGGASVGPGDDDPILQIISEGGFVPEEVALSNGPRYTLLGDGRLIFQGFQTLQYPGPLLPPYLLATVDSDQKNDLLRIVEEIGLPDIDDETDDGAMNMVADASTDVITYWDENGKHRYAVYALGFEESPSDRNAAFLELINTLDRYTGEAPAEPYEPTRVRVVAGPATIDPDFEDTRAWPLDTTDFSNWERLANDWNCLVMEGPVPAFFAEATQATTWENPDGGPDPIKLLVRPLHPGEPGCPS